MPGSQLIRRTGAARKDIYADAGMLTRQPLDPIPELEIKRALPPTPFGPGMMLRNKRYKLCIYGEDQGQLFDPKVNPHETINLYEDSWYNHTKIKNDGALNEAGHKPRHNARRFANSEHSIP